MALAVAFATFAISPQSHASSGGRVGGASHPPGSKAFGDSLTYESFSNFNCSQLGFFTEAVANMQIQGHVVISGTTFLDGVPYDTYTEDLQTGPDTFDTEFSRDFTPPPPPGSDYSFVFQSRVFADGRLVGISTTTIDCENGSLLASNVWVPQGEPIPAGHPLAWAALALLLATAGAARLARRRA